VPGEGVEPSRPLGGHLILSSLGLHGLGYAVAIGQHHLVANPGTYSLLGAITGAAVSAPLWFSGVTGSWFLIAGLAPGVGAVVGAILGACLGPREARADGIAGVVLIAIVVAVLYGVALLILSSIGPE